MIDFQFPAVIYLKSLQSKTNFRHIVRMYCGRAELEEEELRVVFMVIVNIRQVDRPN